MPLLPLNDPFLFLPQDPPVEPVAEVLVLGPAAAAEAPEPSEPAPVEAPPAPPAPPPPPFALPPEDAFPTLAELDAIRAAHGGPAAGPDAAERAAAAALLGLDPALAVDPDAYADAIAALPDPDADAVLAAWLSEAEAGLPTPEHAEPAGDWMLG